MTSSCTDITIDAALADPMIRAMMRADRVDAGELEALLRASAQSLRGETTASMPSPRPAARRWALCGTHASW